EIMTAESTHDQSFHIERHGEVAVVVPSSKVEEMHEALMEQAAVLVFSTLKKDRPEGVVIDLSKLNYVGSTMLNFMLRCHVLAKKMGSEIVLAGASAPARELLQQTDLETIWAIYPTRKEAIEALSGSD